MLRKWLLVTCSLLVMVLLFTPLGFAQTLSPFEFTSDGIVIRTPSFLPGQSVSLYLYGGQRPFEPGYVAGQIKATLTDIERVRSILEIYSSDYSQRNAGIKLLPTGAVVIGGVSHNEFNPGLPTLALPVNLPANFQNMSHNIRNSGIYDFFFSMPTPEDIKSRLGLFVRNMTVHDIGKPADVLIRRSQGYQAGDQIKYGEIQPLNAGESIGTLKWETYARDGFHLVSAIYARNDTVPYTNESPGTMYIATDGGKNDPEIKSRMTIRYNGYVGIGTGQLEPQTNLHVFGDTRIDSDLSVGGGCRGCADLAEDYPSREKLEAGDLVEVDDSSKNISIKKSTSKYAHRLIGIISTTPAIRINEEGGVALSKGDNSMSTGGFPVALSGRVPAKVSTENGPIRIGDYLTSSSVPGVAMKANSSGKVAGMALENYEQTGPGKIKVLVDLNWFSY